MTDERTRDEGDAAGSLLGSLPAILWQRRWLIIIPAVLLAVAGIATAYLLPRVYRSSATLLVESQDLPGEAATGDDPIDRRMAKIRQQILARPDLVDLIQTNNLYDAANRTKPLSTLVDQMRDDTKIAAVDADIQRAGPGRNAAGSIAFSLSFDYPRPAQAQLVAQTFVDRLLKLDAASTQQQAQTSVNFLQDQESDLRAKLEGVEAQINRITGVNGAALSSATVGLIGTGAGIDYASQIASLQRENAQLRAQSGSAIERDPNVTAAETQLAVAKATYADNHPDVKLAETRLAAARANARNFQTRGVSALVQQQLNANDTAIGRLTTAMSVERSRATALAAAQSRGPAVAQQVSQLQATAEGIRSNLAKVQGNLLNARSASRIVEEQRGERLLLIDPPVMADKPISPNRPQLVAGGIVGGLAVGLVLALLVEVIFRPIRSVGQITAALGEPPLGVVPVLNRRGRRPRSQARRRFRLPFRRRRIASFVEANASNE